MKIREICVLWAFWNMTRTCWTAFSLDAAGNTLSVVIKLRIALCTYGGSGVWRVGSNVVLTTKSLGSSKSRFEITSWLKFSAVFTVRSTQPCPSLIDSAFCTARRILTRFREISAANSPTRAISTGYPNDKTTKRTKLEMGFQRAQSRRKPLPQTCRPQRVL